jgi:hypothetical protein
MPWPKGKPRIGHINKDGSAHKPKGAHNIKVVKPVAPVYTQTKTVKPEGLLVEKSPTLWGYGSRPIIEPCPNCNYAYADGGWCPECPYGGGDTITADQRREFNASI